MHLFKLNFPSLYRLRHLISLILQIISHTFLIDHLIFNLLNLCLTSGSFTEFASGSVVLLIKRMLVYDFKFVFEDVSHAVDFQLDLMDFIFLILPRRLLVVCFNFQLRDISLQISDLIQTIPFLCHNRIDSICWFLEVSYELLHSGVFFFHSFYFWFKFSLLVFQSDFFSFYFGFFLFKSIFFFSNLIFVNFNFSSLRKIFSSSLINLSIVNLSFKLTHFFLFLQHLQLLLKAFNLRVNVINLSIDPVFFGLLRFCVFEN